MAISPTTLRRQHRPHIAAGIVPRRDILGFVDQVARKFRPIKVILFGSYAYGKPNENSDVDLLVIMRHRRTWPPKATQISLACPHKFPMDLLVRSPAEIRERIEMGDCFMEEITEKGVVLYEADHAGMGG